MIVRMASRGDKKRNKEEVYCDYSLLFLVIFLLGFGLVMLYSTSSYEAQVKFGSSTFYLRKQIIATLLGIVVLIVFMLIDYHFWARFAIAGYFFSIILILMVLTPLGIEANGARRWVNLGLSVQPAEAAKVAMILFFSYLVCKMGKRIQKTKAMLLTIALVMPIVLMLIVVTNNLSSAIIIFGIVILMIFVSSPQYARFVLLGLLGVGSAVGIVYAIASGIIPEDMSFRFARINAWLDPESYAVEQGFQTLQALYAIGSGGIFGKGLGQSMQKLGFLPEAQNDMIFSIICEELGLFGAICIIILFLLLLWRCMIIANNAPDLFGSLLVVGVMGHIAIQVILNIAVVTNSIPNTGITLPFISYGGTSVLFLLMEMGLVLSVSRRIKLEMK